MNAYMDFSFVDKLDIRKQLDSDYFRYKMEYNEEVENNLFFSPDNYVYTIFGQPLN